MANIDRADVAGLIRDEYSNIFTQTVDTESAAIRAFGSVPLNTKTTTTSVLSTLPEAKWVSESFTDPSGKKPTSKLVWENKHLVAEELAVIIPVHENTLADATEDILKNIAERGAEAISKALDAAVFFGVNKPASWTSPALFQAATAAGNIFQVDAASGTNDLAGSLIQAASAIAETGGDPDAILASKALRFQLANLRDANGASLFTAGLGNEAGDILGLSPQFVKGFDVSKALALVADTELIKIGVRQDITVKLLDQATVNGVSLAETDHVAMRFVARFGYVLGDVLTADGVKAAPVAAVTPAV